MNDSADKAFEDLVRRLVVIERAIEKTEDLDSLSRIDTFVRCLDFSITSVRLSCLTLMHNSFLIPKAQDVYDMRYAALWKKAVNIEHYREKVSEAMKELDQRSKDLFVRYLSAQ